MRIKSCIASVAMALLAAIVPLQCADALAATPTNPLPPAPVTILDVAQSAEARAWAAAEMAPLSLRQRVEQLMVVRIDATDNASGRAAVKQMVDMGVGGLLFGKASLADYAGLIAYAQSIAKIPLLITLDGEWGLKMRVTDAPAFPVNMALGASTDDDALEAYGAEVARECRAVGIHVNFAPVLDVNSNPANPVIGYRSFGEDPARVARAGIAYSRGLESGGVLSVAKHFPGHGDTSTDSHKTLPVVDHSREQLNSVDLLPFKRYIHEGLGGVMVGHLKVPALDPSGTSASLSSKITTDLLQDKMKFRGLVFTDALAMAGANSAGESNCVGALRAGADVLLQPRSVKSDVDAVVAAVGKGSISREEIDRRCMKMLQFKYALGLSDPIELLSPAEAVAVVKSPQAAEAEAATAAASLTAVYNRSDLLPLRQLGEKRIAVVSIGADRDNAFARTCALYAPVETYAAGQNGLTKATLRKIEQDADVIIAACFTDKPWAREALTSLQQAAGRDKIVGVFFMNPYKMAHFGAGVKELGALMLAGDDTPAMRTVAAEGLFGGVAVNGRMPVGLKGIASLGEGVSLPKVRLGIATPEAAGFAPDFSWRIDSIMNGAVSAGAIPGGQVVVLKGGNIVVQRNYGRVDPAAKALVTDSTIYDLASVTKCAATITGLMRAYDDDLFELNDHLSSKLPELKGTDKEKLTFRDALYHVSGLPAMLSILNIYCPKEGKGRAARRALRKDLISTSRRDGFTTPLADGLWLSDASPDTLMQHIYDAELRNPGRYLYSDLNFCLLKEAEERMTEVDHEQWVVTEVFGPLGASSLQFNPKEAGYPLRHIAPTERDDDFRHQRVRGYVHDETAAVSGGVQGNAGLFGNALDLAKVCQLWLNRGSYGGEQLISKRAVEAFTSPKTRREVTSAKGAKTPRGLGFAFVDDDSPAPADTYGHTGFTGTCFWVDPVNEIVIVVLTNRVCPSRKTPAFFRADPRKAVVEAVYRKY